MIATHYNILQHNAKRCNTLQHAATHLHALALLDLTLEAHA